VANVGIPDNPSAVSMRTFPNPAHDQLNIALTGAAPGPESLRVLDALGRVVLSEKVDINGATWWYALPVAKLDAGNYTLLLGDRVARFNVMP
ncbi:MAG: T9SS type A sorting domain-containing protein, partial [Flavobacteriales bacterium]